MYLLVVQSGVLDRTYTEPFLLYLHHDPIFKPEVLLGFIAY